ncbi:DUF2163 domain-containing protein [Herbaspirillum sp. RV1423]|uniref:DUF2163 domain-containing protein n=1 Tax=Herbaspirillum sp. RV1423 TaxID=1443993 RepID=UPI0005535432|nr:DUF2163 domain-containing protein [Herbaspirillum sp. RV1423]
MKNSTTALTNLLNSGQPFFMADLYTFSLINGTVLRYALWDSDISYLGNTFSSSGPTFKRSKIRLVIGVEVDTLDLSVFANASHLINGQPWLQAARAGALDGAALRVDRVFMSAPPVPVGGVIQFTGMVAPLIVGRTEAKITVASYFQLLNVQMPRNLFQPGCLHTLYDSGCGVARSSVAVGGSVSSASTTSIVSYSMSAYPTGYFDAGYLGFATGALAGTTRTIKSFSSPSVMLLNPLPTTPSPGDTFYIYPGCDKSQATCQNKFNNLPRFRGIPYIPVPETAQ